MKMNIIELEKINAPKNVGIDIIMKSIIKDFKHLTGISSNLQEDFRDEEVVKKICRRKKYKKT